MLHSRAKRPPIEGLSTTLIGERVCAFLRSLHPSRTVENVAADLTAWRISDKTIRNMFERGTAPGAVLWIALLDTYGADFLGSIHPPALAWLKPSIQHEQQEAIRRDLAALQARLDALA